MISTIGRLRAAGVLALSIALSGVWVAPNVASALLVDLDTISTPRSTEPGAVSVHHCTFVTGATPTPGTPCTLLADFGSIGYAADEQPIGDFFAAPLVAASSLPLVWTDGHRALAGGARLLWTGLAPGDYQITLLSHNPIGTTLDSTIFEVNGSAPFEIPNVPNPAPGSDLFALQSRTVPVLVDDSGRIEIRYRAGNQFGIGVLNGLVLVPEPGSVLLLGLGLCVLRRRGRRRGAIGSLAAAMLFLAGSWAVPASALLQDVEPGNDDRLATPSSLARDTVLVADGGRLELGSSETCPNLGPCDLDFIALTGLQAGDFIAVSTTLRGDLGLAEPDTLVGILDSNGILLASDEDLDFPSRVGFRVAADGDYVVGVTGSPDYQLTGDHMEVGPYELSVAIFQNNLTGQTVRDREPFNDSIALLNTISESIARGPEPGIFAGSFTLAYSLNCVDAVLPCDVDFVKLTGMVAGDLMTIATFPVGDPGDPDPFAPDTYVGIFDAAGQPLDTEIDNSAGSLMEFSVPADGDYFVGVTGTVDDFFEGDHSETGPYKLMISLFPVPEPASTALAGAAVASLHLLARFRRQAGG